MNEYCIITKPKNKNKNKNKKETRHYFNFINNITLV